MNRYVMAHQTARDNAKRAIDTAPDGHVVTIKPPQKSRDQEEKYHAIFGEAAKHCRHLNREFDAEGWKRLLLDAFRTEALTDPHCPQVVRDDLASAVQMVPSLDGRSIVAIGLQSRKFRKETASAFIEYLLAFMAENEVTA